MRASTVVAIFSLIAWVAFSVALPPPPIKYAPASCCICDTQVLSFFADLSVLVSVRHACPRPRYSARSGQAGTRLCPHTPCLKLPLPASHSAQPLPPYLPPLPPPTFPLTTLASGTHPPPPRTCPRSRTRPRAPLAPGPHLHPTLPPYLPLPPPTFPLAALACSL